MFAVAKHLDHVSIHAPARGATFTTCSRMVSTTSFNPRAREGRDVFSLLGSFFALRFQSTRPRGARPSPNTLFVLQARFNPRAREGRDLMFSFLTWALVEFQSTRPRGARQ